jgi:hypothetical protein
MTANRLLVRQRNQITIYGILPLFYLPCVLGLVKANLYKVQPNMIKKYICQIQFQFSIFFSYQYKLRIPGREKEGK